MRILKIDDILKNNVNYIGTYSKDNVPLLKNNQSTIINLQDSDKKGSHWVSYKRIGKKLDDKLKENNKLIREFILKNIKKDDLPIK